MAGKQDTSTTKKGFSKHFNMRRFGTALRRIVTITPQRARALARLPLPLVIRFMLAHRLNQFLYKRSAIQLLKSTPLSRYPARLQASAANIIGAVRPDKEAEDLMGIILDRLLKTPKESDWQALLTWYSCHSKIDDAERIETVDRLASISFDNEKGAFRRQVAIAKAQIEVREAACIHFETPSFLPSNWKEQKGSLQLIVFVKPLRLSGYDKEALEILDALQTKHHQKYLIQMAQNFPGMLDLSDLQKPNRSKSQVTLLSAIYSIAGADPRHTKLLRTLIREIQEAFPYERLKNRHRILEILTKIGLREEAIECLNQSGDSQNETLVPARILRAWEKYYSFDFQGAATDFKKIVLEAPDLAEAKDGLRFASARCGKTMAEIYDQETELAGQPLPDSEANVWRLFEQGDFARLGLDYQKGKRWQSLYTYLGDRMIRKWPAGEKIEGSLLFIADQGVGDEIRQYGYYNELVKVFDVVHATCDPRLKRLLEANFPDIQFHPVWRTRLGLTDRIHRIDNRIKGFGGVLYNNLSEDIRPLLDSVTCVTNHGALMVAKAEGKLNQTTNVKAVYSTVHSLDQHPNKLLRIGVLWRSSLVHGTRSLMYLSAKSLDPILKVKEVEFHCIQHGLTPEERAFCASHDVVVPDIDLYDDFDGMASYISSLDLVIGISTVPAELAAALGVPVWFLGFSPENLFLRTNGGQTETDQLTRNAIVIGPQDRNFNRPAQDCIADTVNMVCHRLRSLIGQP